MFSMCFAVGQNLKIKSNHEIYFIEYLVRMLAARLVSSFVVIGAGSLSTTWRVSSARVFRHGDADSSSSNFRLTQIQLFVFNYCS